MDHSIFDEGKVGQNQKETSEIQKIGKERGEIGSNPKRSKQNELNKESKQESSRRRDFSIFTKQIRNTKGWHKKELRLCPWPIIKIDDFRNQNLFYKINQENLFEIIIKSTMFLFG